MKKLGFKKNIYFIYSILFILILIIGLLPIEIKNKSFLFSGLFADRNLGIDGLKQHLLFMYDFVSSIKDFIFHGQPLSSYNYSIGLGSDFILSYTYYSLFDPLTIIAYIIPIKYIEVSYYLLIVLRLYLSGVFVILLTKKIGITKTKALIATSIFYVFNVTVLYSAFRHPMFINGPMLIPLIILGVEKVLKDEKPYLLIIATFYALVSQFYFFIYSTFGFELYVIIRLFKEIKNKSFSNFFKLNLLFLLGTTLGGIVLFPQLFGVLMGGRASSKGFVLYNGFEYGSIISSLFVPLVSTKYTSSIGNILIFYPILLFIFNEKKKSIYSLYFIILTSLLMFASFGYAINVFSYVNNRWTYLITFAGALIIGKFINDQRLVEKNAFYNSIKFILGLVVVTAVSYGIYFIGILNINQSIIIILRLLIISLGIYVLFIIYKLKINISFDINKLVYSKAYIKSIVFSSLIVTLVVSTIYTFYLTPNNSFRDYYGSKDTFDVITRDTDFFRVEQKEYVAGVNSYSNDSIYYGFSSSSQYNTMTNGYVNNFIENYNVVNTNNTVGYNGFNLRTRLLAINNVKYVIIRESEKTLPPYGFKYYDTVYLTKYDETKKIYDYNGNLLKENEKAIIYVNENFLKFGVVFDSYITEEEFNLMSSITRESIILDTVVMESSLDNLKKFEYKPLVLESLVKDYQLNNIRVDNNTIEVFEEEGTIKFVINKIINSEVYVQLKGIENEDKYTNFITKYSTKDVEVEEANYGLGKNMYIENRDHLLNLGYYENEDLLEVTITFQKGIYHFDSISYYLNPVDDIISKIEKLNENSLSELVLTRNGFTGKINSTKEGLLYISLPFSEGFSAFVDEEEVEIHRTNTGFMGIIVSGGQHNIEFVYNTPGLDIGLYFSFLSLIIILFMVRRDIYKKNKEED